ncbi:NAD(P)H-binding protein [Winogradskyella sp.]|uniref:NAD(P)H-binding protein n=1 Tax=Winogradskyella sp. TaxID=1883156 RepID=UPI003F6B7C33
MLKPQISVIGCGWLGLPLGKELIENGHTVNGSTTSPEKLAIIENNGMLPFLIELNETGIKGNIADFLNKSDTVIINIPPGLRKNTNKNHVAEITLLLKEVSKTRVKNIIYVSSTSVFEDDSEIPIITDKTRPNGTSEAAKQLIEIEHLLREKAKLNTTIIRFGGLFDSKRQPANYLSGKNNIANPKAPINLIHKSDCIEIISEILKQEAWNITLNAVYPAHPEKQLYYSDYCKQHNLDVPSFNTSEKSKGKIVDSTKLIQLLSYTFKEVP